MLLMLHMTSLVHLQHMLKCCKCFTLWLALVKDRGAAGRRWRKLLLSRGLLCWNMLLGYQMTAKEAAGKLGSQRACVRMTSWWQGW